MIKRFGHILIIFVLLFGTTGMSIIRHYCGSNLINTAIYSTPDNCCKEDCKGCHNEKITFRITDQFESCQTQLDFKLGFTTLLEKHSLPTILAFSNTVIETLLNDTLGDHCIKPTSPKPICAGQSSPFLQVFLF